MACPTCDHTMQKIATERVFWCPRCGTLKDCVQRTAAGLPDEVEEGGNDLGVSEPMLVGRAFRVHQEALDYIAIGFDRDNESERLQAAVRDADECIGSPS